MYLCHNNAPIPYSNLPSNYEQRRGVLGCPRDKDDEDVEMRRRIDVDDDVIDIPLPDIDRLEIRDDIKKKKKPDPLKEVEKTNSLELRDGSVIHDIDTLILCTG